MHSISMLCRMTWTNKEIQRTTGNVWMECGTAFQVAMKLQKLKPHINKVTVHHSCYQMLSQLRSLKMTYQVHFQAQTEALHDVEHKIFLNYLVLSLGAVTQFLGGKKQVILLPMTLPVNQLSSERLLFTNRFDKQLVYEQLK